MGIVIAYSVFPTINVELWGLICRSIEHSQLHLWELCFQDELFHKAKYVEKEMLKVVPELINIFDLNSLPIF